KRVFAVVAGLPVPADTGRVRRGLEQSVSTCRRGFGYAVFGLLRDSESPRSGAFLRRQRGTLHRPDLRTAVAIPLPVAPVSIDTAFGYASAQAGAAGCRR